ncbi:MAG: VacJ family lipoprotein [Candidatus Omnitrophica bacterium]|nr:VacJ family lipoprotein [Candidatus Omnitrophota bacterium]
MKPFWLMLCWLALTSRAGAQQLTNTTADPLPPNSTNETAEGSFFDPFATEKTTVAPKEKTPDPLEPMNRVFFQINDKLYFWVLKPVAKGYNQVAPQPFRTSVRRFFVNVKYPIRVANNFLQGRIKGVGIETARFVVNSTVGLAGFFDPASKWNIEMQPADFNQTLGYYGMPPIIYFDWPFLGPSSVRGTLGTAGDTMLTPWTYIDGLWVSLGVRPYETVNATSLRLGEYESFKQAALDPYVAMRSAYFETQREFIEHRGPGTRESFEP